MTIFLAYRPWLLLLLSAVLTRAGWRFRASAVALSLLLASGSEGLLAALLGGGGVLAAGVRAMLAGLLLATALDLLFLLARRVEPRFDRLLGLMLGAGLLLLPGPLRVYERIALPPPPPPVGGPMPVATLLTGLPILWGEGGAAAAIGQGPSIGYRRLAAEFRLRPIDIATPAALARAPLLLAAQPREMASDEIEAIDAWVRMGGRALLLVDPDLRWPSALPPGDPRRPPRRATLAPLLARWDVTVARPEARDGIGTLDMDTRAARRRIVVDAPGVLRAEQGCRLAAEARAAACRIGRGYVLILADADMLDDRLWVGAGADGAGRIARGGDNAVLLADWLDALAGAPRSRASDSVFWAREAPFRGIAGALAPVLAVGLFGLFGGGFRSSHRRKLHQTCPTGLSTGTKRET
ncbi:MAG: hypothetical protein ABW173_10665 [Sphingomonas sp.]